MSINDQHRKRIEDLATGAAFDDLPENDSARIMQAFFASVSSPEELHVFADWYDWEAGLQDLHHVIRHPLCDLGTALLVFWRGNPGYCFVVHAERDALPDHEQETWDVLHEIKTRVVAGQYRSATQAFDPANDEGIDWRPNPALIEKHGCSIPGIMYQSVKPANS